MLFLQMMQLVYKLLVCFPEGDRGSRVTGVVRVVRVTLLGATWFRVFGRTELVSRQECPTRVSAWDTPPECQTMFGRFLGVRVCVRTCRFHLDFSPNSLLLGVLNALKNGRLRAGWSGRVPGRLVSDFPSFVSQFFSFVSHTGCLWSGSRLACLPLPFICLPLLFTCLPVLFICLPHWVLAVGFPAVLSPASFHLSPLLPSSGLLCPPNPLHLSPCVYICLPALDCCGRLCLVILCLPALGVAGSSCRVFRFRKTQTVWRRFLGVRVCVRTCRFHLDFLKMQQFFWQPDRRM